MMPSNQYGTCSAWSDAMAAGTSSHLESVRGTIGKKTTPAMTNGTTASDHCQLANKRFRTFCAASAGVRFSAHAS